MVNQITTFKGIYNKYQYEKEAGFFILKNLNGTIKGKFKSKVL